MRAEYHIHEGLPASDSNLTTTKKLDLLTCLLYLMGQTLGYNFTNSNLRVDVYIPLDFVDLEIKERFLRTKLADIVDGKSWLPVIVKNVD